MKSKTASVRLPKEMYEEIDSICDDIGCTRNDWIKDTLKEKLREEPNENTQDQEVTREIELEPKIQEVKEEPTVTEIKEPQKITIEVPQNNSQKPSITYKQFDGKLLPFAQRYNI